MVLTLFASRPILRNVMVVTALAAFSNVAFLSDASAARRRYKSTSSHYSPPQASISIDGHSGLIIQSYKADEPRFPASLTKIMTLYLLFDALKKGRVAMDTELAITEHAASQSPTKLGLKVGDTIAVKDAIRALVTKSANDAAVAIAENLAGSETSFAKVMTQRARALGMKNSTFRNASGLPNPEQVTTAYDLSVLARAVLRDFPEHAGFFQLKYFKYGRKLYKNHNGLLFSYEGVEGMKTGFTNASGFNLVTTARRNGKFLVSVVLGGRSSGQRNESMRTLLDASWARAKTRSEYEAERLVAMRANAQRKVQVASVADFGAKPATFEKPNSRPGTFQDQVRVQASASQTSDVQPVSRAEARPATVTAAVQGKPITPQKAAKPAGPTEPSIRLSAAVEIGARPAPIVNSRTALQPAAIQPSQQVAPSADFPGPYHVQVGAYDNAASAQTRLSAILREAGDIVAGHPDFVLLGVLNGRNVVRARFGAFTHTGAFNACEALRIRAIDCIIVQN